MQLFRELTIWRIVISVNRAILVYLLNVELSLLYSTMVPKLLSHNRCQGSIL